MVGLTEVIQVLYVLVSVVNPVHFMHSLLISAHKFQQLAQWMKFPNLSANLSIPSQMI